MGTPNTCGQGCYRGVTAEKRMRMVGFPPTPQYVRSFECWKRTEPYQPVAG